jgi:hypothetical protein
MALTRKFLKAMGIEDEKIDQIIEEHVTVTDALKKERDDARADAQALPGVKKELEDLKAAGDGGYKEKYDAAQKEIAAYKAKETRAGKEAAYREILKSAGIRDKYMDTVIRADGAAIDALTLADGKAEKAEEIAAKIKTTWADFIGTAEERHGGVSNPPANNGGTAVTKETIMSIKDPVARREAIAQNINLFGKGDN